MNVHAMPLRLKPESDIIADLRAEVRDLRRQLGLDVERSRALALRRRFGVSPRQAELLTVLYGRRGKVVSDTAIHDALYGLDPTGGPSLAIIKCQICKMRSNIVGRVIENVRGYGYRLTPLGLRLCDEAVSA